MTTSDHDEIFLESLRQRLAMYDERATRLGRQLDDIKRQHADYNDSAGLLRRLIEQEEKRLEGPTPQQSLLPPESPSNGIAPAQPVANQPEVVRAAEPRLGQLPPRRPEFVGMKLEDAVGRVLDQMGGIMHVKEVGRLIFDTHDEGDIKHASHSLVTALHRGKRKGLFRLHGSNRWSLSTPANGVAGATDEQGGMRMPAV